MTKAIRLIYDTGGCSLHEIINPFAAEELLPGVPRKEKGNGEFHMLTLGRWHIEPLGLVGSCDECLFKDSLRPNINILQIKMDIRERAQQLLIELGGSRLSVPAHSTIDNRIHTVLRECSHQA